MGAHDIGHAHRRGSAHARRGEQAPRRLRCQLMASIDEDIEAADTTAIRANPWPRLANLPERLAEASFAPDAFRMELKEAHAELVERFRADESVETLVHARAELIDAILREVWRSQLPAGYQGWALAAVGGYGR